jgi:hypothetical protein
MRRFRPALEQVEGRLLPTRVFIFSGDALGPTGPTFVTQLAADQLRRHGVHPIQMSTPALNSPRVVYRIANDIRHRSHDQPIGLLGFSAGGALAMRLAGLPGLNVPSVMNYYGPPDLKDWIAFHGHDAQYRYVMSQVHLTRGLIDLFSGPSPSQTYFVNAFGLYDRNVVSSVSIASFYKDFQHGQVSIYPSIHGVTLYADYGAFQDFLDHL